MDTETLGAHMPQRLRDIPTPLFSTNCSDYTVLSLYDLLV